MAEQKLEVPPDIRELVEKTIDQTEKAFSFFFNAATATMPSPDKSALALAERNINAAFDYARKLANARDVQEVMTLQADFLRAQIEITGEFMRAWPTKE